MPPTATDDGNHTDEETPDRQETEDRDPLIEMVDGLIPTKEDLKLLEIAALQAHRRDKKFSDMLRWRIFDIRKQLEDLQEDATSVIAERRRSRQAAENGGGDDE